MSRVYLKMKIMSLAAEARIIRREEGRWKGARGSVKPAVFWGLRSHRTLDVRREARAALIAYGFIRGRPYAQIEGKCLEQPDWPRVRALINKFGPDKQVTMDAVMAWSVPAELGQQIIDAQAGQHE